MKASYPGTIVAPLVAALVQEAAARGASREDLLEPLGLSTSELADADHRVAADALFACWETAMKATKDPTLPVAVGRRATIEGFGVLGYALYTASSFVDAFEVLRRHHDLVNDTGSWSLERRTSDVVVSWTRPGERSLGVRAANEQVVVSFATAAREVFGAPLPLTEVLFAHAKPGREADAALAECFGAPVRWSAEHDALVLGAGALALEPKRADAVLASYFRRSADDALRRIARDDSWSARAARAVSDRLPQGLPPMDAIAKDLGSTGRTLRRRLLDEGTTFRAVVENVQRERAKELMKNRTKVRDVAFALGFSDATAFSRAYRRWTGSAPRDVSDGAIKSRKSE